MSHHYSGPNIGFPRGDARLDLTDLYAFAKPGDPDKSILIMNVHPSVGLNPKGPTTGEPFAPKARYELRIDTDRDRVGLGLVVKILTEHHEFIPRQTGQCVTRPERSGQSLGHGHQQLVSNLVPVGVIDRLETVEVDEEQGR